MPIFEYLCKGCNRQFEAIVQGGAQPQCPDCHGEKLEQQLSVFSVGAAGRAAQMSSSSSSPSGGCGSCGDPRGPGSCNIN